MDQIIVTGFGPFKEHKINASWEAVKILPSIAPKTYNIITKEIPVTYEDVDKNVKDLWTIQPKLVLHVGVSSFAQKLTIETIANRSGYCKVDCNQKYHPTNEVCTKDEGLDMISCGIDVQQICRNVNFLCKNDVVCVSENAGRYLCEYIFYKSMLVNPQRTLFVHVPPLNKPFSAEKIAELLLEIIKITLSQLNECECS